MRFALASEDKDFFAKNQYIEFEHLLPIEEAQKLKETLEELLAGRLKTSRARLPYKTAKELFLQGRDCWRESPLVKRLILHSALSELAASLFKKKPLRLAYDQLFLSKGVPDHPFSKEFSLSQMSSLQPLAGGLFLRLSHGDALSSSQNFCPLPKQIGSGIFVGPDLPLSLAPLLQLPHQSVLLIVYSPERANYIFEKNDLHAQVLKKQGYVLGDLVRNHTHPLVYQ